MYINKSKIRDLSFSDLILTDENRFFLRYLSGSTSPIIEIINNEALLKEITELKYKLTVSKEKEFLFLWDNIPFRVTKIITIKGEHFFLRRPFYPVPDLVNLGYLENQLVKLKSLCGKSGLVLFSGATGSGKTTSMYSLMTELVKKNGDIVISIEDPPEIPVESIYGNEGHGLWYQIDAQMVGGYEKAMISAMRYNPKFIMMGEIRSAEAANQAVRAAVNGHLVLTTIHGSSIQGAILALQQIAAAGMQSQDLARAIISDGLTGVVHQSLVRDKITGKRTMKSSSLFIDSDDGIKTKIRNGKLELLSTDIYNQNIASRVNSST